MNTCEGDGTRVWMVRMVLKKSETEKVTQKKPAGPKLRTDVQKQGCESSR